MVKSIDWNQVWRDEYNKNLACRFNRDWVSEWTQKENAKSFLKCSEENPERIRNVIEKLQVTPASSVLDIGSGPPGTLAVPLAGVAGHVTAVEPSAGMLEVMEEYARKNEVSNIDILQKRWEDVDVKEDLGRKYDVVTACYSLCLPDIHSAIESMCQASSDSCHIFWFAGVTGWERAMNDLWPLLHEKSYCCDPKADVLYNVLYSMGIYPDVQSYVINHSRKYDTIDSAVHDLKSQYCADSEEKQDTLRNYLLRQKTADWDGIEIGGAVNHVHFSWKVSPSDGGV
ncbi:bifunctional 2-polyprenyl-6-hydroxyphenol methylase/3-demethylubiquinol 3-O-methyltransferase UbiG [Methanogenium cariaci]|uniref:class I SAM-dependent methyltransferase n=1 Tax=Methanogenium cariaci TaxID=2197 RepID=UPI0007858B29|nr:class I SAM-dependent methyltransferase [Methanogenium cariaci]